MSASLVCFVVFLEFAMLFVLSPAKKLDFDSPLPTDSATQPRFVKQASALIEVLRDYSQQEVASLMSLSPALAELNVARYREWQPHFSPADSRPAIFAFNGDVYEGLQADKLSQADLDWAQDHVAILSGLYGVLRPLDLMRPYRLEMGTRLAVGEARNLYGYWGDQLAESLTASLAEQGGEPVVIKLASDEYFKSVDRPALKARVVDCVFQDWKNGAWKVISFHAKRARGLMARHAIEQRIDQVDGLRSFEAEGYAWDGGASSDARLVFRRRQ